MAEKEFSMVEKDVFMATKGETFNSFVSETPMITLDKLTGKRKLSILGRLYGPMVYW